jgi:hypothetical protein
VRKAETAAIRENAPIAESVAKMHWDQVSPTLICSLCDKTEETWRPIFSQGTTHRWYERQYKQKSITLCPTCGTGLWYSHGPTKWEILEPKYKCQHSSIRSTWERGKNEMIAKNIEDLREENAFSSVKDKQVDEILKQKGHHALFTNPLTKTPPRKRRKPSSKTSEATQKVALVWKEDMETIECNKENREHQ